MGVVTGKDYISHTTLELEISQGRAVIGLAQDPPRIHLEKSRNTGLDN